MPEIGELAPDFSLSDQDGQEVRLSSLRGAPVVLYFYPKDDTPGCTKEACSFRDARLDYEQAGATVIGVSPDGVAKHKKFAMKHALEFRLLADPETTVCQAYRVWKEKSMYGRTYWGVERTTFVIDKDGRLSHIFPKVKVNGHSDAVLKALRGS